MIPELIILVFAIIGAVASVVFGADMLFKLGDRMGEAKRDRIRRESNAKQPEKTSW